MASKQCSKCREMKETSEFYARSSGYLGVRADCKVCFNAVGLAYREAHKECRSSVQSALYQKDRERINAVRNEWRRNNKDAPSVVALKTRSERVRINTPAWADRSAITAIYSDAKEFRDGGLNVHVDHIIPLVGKVDGVHVVCGLHVENNLTVKLQKWNDSRGSAFHG